MTHLVLEVPRGDDVVRAILEFARSGGHAGLTVLCASGTVSSAVIGTGVPHVPAATLTWPHILLSLRGYYTSLPNGGFRLSFSAILAGSNGQVICGEVVGPVVANEPLIVVLSVSGVPLLTRPMMS